MWYRLVSEGAAFYDKLMADLASDGLETDAYARCGALILGQSVEYLQEVHDRALERRKQAPLIGNVAILKGTEIKKSSRRSATSNKPFTWAAAPAWTVGN